MAFHLRFLLLLAFLSSALLDTASAYGGSKAGERTEIQGVASNEEVQDLGWFSVVQYNERLRHKGAGGPLLTFFSVVSGQQQVVKSGVKVKYYLRVAVTVDGVADAKEARRIYDAIVFVNPSEGGFRTLVSFQPVHLLADENNF